MARISLNLWLLPIGISLLGIATGYARATDGPLPAEVSDESVQTTVASIASTVGQLVYIPTVIGVNWMAATHGIIAAYALNAFLFAIFAGTAIIRVARIP